MLNRLVSLALVAVAILMSGCANPVGIRGQAVHRTNHSVVAVDGSTVIPAQQVRRVVSNGTVYEGRDRDPYSADRCPGGYRQINGVYRCMDGERVIRPRVIYDNDDDEAYERPRARRHPADCDIGNRKDYPDLQNRDVSEERCAALRRAERHTSAGKCEIDGVNHPDLVGNPDRCDAKRKEIGRAANSKAQPKTYGKIADAARNAQGHPCFVGNKAGDLLADFMVETKNPYGELATSGPKCKALVERFREEHGGAIAKN